MFYYLFAAAFEGYVNSPTSQKICRRFQTF